MIKKNNILKSPGGMRSYLPEVATELKNIENDIMDVFELWGYQPIKTPTLEYFESLTEGMGRTLDKKLYKFIDYEGNILALRPEMTAPIARTLSTRLNEVELPLRLSYNASVFRYDQPQTGKNREIYQLGVEFIGEKNYLADAETIILAIESLQNTGIKDFKIDVGHAAFLNGIIKELKLDEYIEYELKSFLNKKDLVGLNNYIEDLDIPDKKVLKRIPLLRGGLEILEDAGLLVNNPDSNQALENLRKIYSYLDSYGFADYITFDLGLSRGFDYYTGVVFEGFTEKLGYTICGGGRYDNLLRKFSGIKIPAIGFAIGIERVRLALKRQKYGFKKYTIDEYIIFNEGTEELALSTAKKMRSRGLVTVVTAAFEQSAEQVNKKEKSNKTAIAETKETGSILAKKGLKRILSFLSPEELEIHDLVDNSKEIISLDQDWEETLWEI
ncbi:MAG: ATP phosphoribosyltransferase regulatory subunit [Halanaerobiales bacterium]